MSEAIVNDAVALEVLVGQVADEFLRQQSDGERPDIEEYAARYPEAADVLRKVLTSLRLLDAAPADEVGALANGDESTGTLGDFHLIREVGRGGMGVVYEAEQISLGRRVALKVLPFAATMDPRQLQRFQNEARAAAGLHHTNIVPVYAVGCERSVHFYAMQFIEGQTVAQLIASQESRDREGAVPPLPDGRGSTVVAAATTQRAPRDAAYFRRVAEWGIQAAEALDCAHALGVVHRDVKPANLLVDTTGRLWVTDFGLAHVLSDTRLTMTGDLVGTLRYMSPEQALAKRVVVDHRTDVYSLGATLYELLTLQPVFSGNDRQELLRQIAFDEPKPPRRINKAIPAELETIVLKTLAKEPGERYATAQELADDLRRFLEHRSIWARRPSWVQRARKWARRHQAVLTAAATTLAVVAAISTVLIWRERDSTLSALHDAQVQRVRAEGRELLARRQLYAAHIAAARRAWESAGPGEVQRLLDQDIPRPGEEDLRSFEWYYLRGLFRGREEPLLTLRGHSGEVYCVQFSPDGKLLVSAGQDHTVRLWDSATGQARAVLRGHDLDVNWAAFSPDGGTLATAGDDGVVKLWDPNTGREGQQVLKAALPVIGVAFSPDGKILAAGLSDGMVRWWDLPSGRERPAFRAHDARIESVTFSPDGRTLATSADNAKLWDAATGKLQRLLFGADPGAVRLGFKVNCIHFNHHGGVVATAGLRLPVQLWEPAGGQPLLSLPYWHGQVESLAFSADDRMLATGQDDGTVRLWNARTGKMLDVLAAQTGRAWCVAFSPDGRTLATAGGDGTVQLWDPDTRQSRKLLSHSQGSGPLAFSQDGKRLIGGSIRKNNKGELSIWELPSGRLEASFPSPLPIVGLALAADGRTLATGHVDGLVTVWDLDQRRPRLTIQAGAKSTTFDPSSVSSLVFTRDGHTLLTNGNQLQVSQWEVSTGRLSRTLTPAGVEHRGLAYSPSRNLVATSAADGIVLWDLASGSSESLPWNGPGSWPRVDAFSPDGSILGGGSDNNVILWDIAARCARAPLLGHRGRVVGTTFSPDGKTLASLSADGEVKLWSAHTGQELLSLEQHPGQTGSGSVAFSPDGRTLAVTFVHEGSEEEVSLWLAPRTEEEVSRRN